MGYSQLKVPAPENKQDSNATAEFSPKSIIANALKAILSPMLGASLWSGRVEKSMGAGRILGTKAEEIEIKEVG